MKALLRALSPSGGRLLVYVWAIDQDDASKRVVPSTGETSDVKEQDVLVPWVLSNGSQRKSDATTAEDAPRVYQRYYHMFAPGELRSLTESAAASLGLIVGPPPNAADSQGPQSGLEIVAEGWERSNHYVEAKRWQIPPTM